MVRVRLERWGPLVDLHSLKMLRITGNTHTHAMTQANLEIWVEFNHSHGAYSDTMCLSIRSQSFKYTSSLEPNFLGYSDPLVVRIWTAGM